MTNGSYFDGCGTALLERNFAVRAGLAVGDRIRVLTAVGREELRIAGLVLSPEHLVLSYSPQALIPAPGRLAVVFVPRDWLRSAFGLGTDDVNEFLFLLSDPGPEVRRAIDAALARDIVIYSLKKDEVYGYVLIKEDLRQGESWAAGIALVMLLIAFFITYVSLTRLVQEQRREIGVLRALGYSRGAVLGAYLYLAALIGLAGSVTGVLIGASLAHALSGFYVELMIGAPLASFTLSPKTLTVGLFFGPLTTLLACGGAVWGTVFLEPQEAIRGSPPVRFSPRDRSGCALSAPVKGSYLTHYAFRHLSRHPVRTCLTTPAMAGSIVIGGMALLMWPAFVNSLSQGLHESERWDLLVKFSSPLNASQLSALAPGDAVEVAPLSRITASWSRAGATDAPAEPVVVVGLGLEQRLHIFRIKEGRRALSDVEAMVERAISERKGIGVGSSVLLRGPGGAQELRVCGVVENSLGGFFVAPEVFEALAGRELYCGLYLSLPEGRGAEVREDLSSSPDVAEVYTPESAQSGILEFMADYENLIYIYSLVGIAMAAVTVSNTVSLGVLERWQEYAQLRAIGSSRRQIASSIITETLVVVGAASLLSVPMTYAVLLALEGEMKSFFPMYSTIIHPADWLGFLSLRPEPCLCPPRRSAEHSCGEQDGAREGRRRREVRIENIFSDCQIPTANNWSYWIIRPGWDLNPSPRLDRPRY